MGVTDVTALLIPEGVGLTRADESPRQRVERLQRDNDAALQALAARGVQIPMAALDTVRLGLLVEHLLGDLDDERRLAYETAVQERFAGLIADIEGQVNRASLLQGVNGAALPPLGAG